MYVQHHFSYVNAFIYSFLLQGCLVRYKILQSHSYYLVLATVLKNVKLKILENDYL